MARKHLQMFVVALACAAAGCNDTAPQMLGTHQVPVVLDAWMGRDFAAASCTDANKWWNDAYRQQSISLVGCQMFTSCPEMKQTVEACAVTPGLVAWSDFEDHLATAFATDASCNGAVFLSYAGPEPHPSKQLVAAMTGPHWFLIVDLVPGRDSPDWSMQRVKAGAERWVKGHGTPNQIAHAVCAVVNERGGTLE